MASSLPAGMQQQTGSDITLRYSTEVIEIKQKKMTIEEAKDLFKKHHPEECAYIHAGHANPNYYLAACVWRGFKSALQVMRHLKK